MRCPGCGDMLQHNAMACITVGCPDYQRPLTAQERHANRRRRPGATAPMRPLNGLANAATALIGAAAVATAVVFPLSRHAAPVTTAPRPTSSPLPLVDLPLGNLDDPLSPVDPTTNLSTPLLVADLLVLVVAVLGAVFFVAWLFRARRNLDALPAANPFWPKSWSLGVWFLPAGNFFMPALVMDDVAKETVAANPDDPNHRRLLWLARMWWVGCVALALSVNVQLDHPDAPAGATVLTVVLALITATACIIFMRDLSALQRQRFEPVND